MERPEARIVDGPIRGSSIEDGPTRDASHPPGRRGAALATFGAGCLASLLVVELLARVVAPYLPAPARYGDSATGVKVAQLDARSGCTRLVLAGNSMARDAFDPAWTATAGSDPIPAYNAALDAASPALLRRWLGEEVIPRTKPGVVVVAIASLDLNGNSKAGRAARAAYDDAPATGAGPVGRVGALAGRHSAAVAHRTALADASAWGPTLDRIRAGTPVPPTTGGAAAIIGPDGQGLANRASHHEPGDPVVRAFVTEQLLNDFAITDDALDDARRLLADLRATGATVVVTALPVTDEYVDLHPRGRADFDAYLRALADLAGAAQVPLLDLHADGRDGEFADTHHLNASGARRFSEALPTRLAELGAAVPPCGA